eukprot:RCo047896
MPCTKCGLALPEGARFCPQCGTRAAGTTPVGGGRGVSGGVDGVGRCPRDPPLAGMTLPQGGGVVPSGSSALVRRVSGSGAGSVATATRLTPAQTASALHPKPTSKKGQAVLAEMDALQD